MTKHQILTTQCAQQYSSAWAGTAATRSCKSPSPDTQTFCVLINMKCSTDFLLIMDLGNRQVITKEYIKKKKSFQFAFALETLSAMKVTFTQPLLLIKEPQQPSFMPLFTLASSVTDENFF